MTMINTLSAAKEMAMALTHLTAAEKKKLLDEFNQTVAADIAASAAKEGKAARIDALKAARSKARTDIGTSNKLGMLDGLLSRHGLPTLEVLAAADVRDTDNIIKSATRPLSVEDRFALKGFLHGLQLA
jgi:hypothetical protein